MRTEDIYIKHIVDIVHCTVPRVETLDIYLDILDNLINTFNQLQSEQRPSHYRISGFIFNIYID